MNGRELLLFQSAPLNRSEGRSSQAGKVIAYNHMFQFRSESSFNAPLTAVLCVRFNPLPSTKRGEISRRHV